MKKAMFVAMSLMLIAFSSCKKCHECHYDGPGGAEVELGEYCDEDLEDLENNGYTIGDTTYTVHCHDH